MPVPDVTVAVLPFVSVTIRITCSGWAVPASLLPINPQVSVSESVELDPLWLRDFTVS